MGFRYLFLFHMCVSVEFRGVVGGEGYWLCKLLFKNRLERMIYEVKKFHEEISLKLLTILFS